MKKPPSDVADRFLVRFHRPGHRDALKVQAAQQKRSLNSQILLLIEAGEASIEKQQEAKQ